jgi:hypothetical protein
VTNVLKGLAISRKYLMEFINPTIAALVCDISIDTRLRTENKNENTNKNISAKSDKKKRKKFFSTPFSNVVVYMTINCGYRF